MIVRVTKGEVDYAIISTGGIAECNIHCQDDYIPALVIETLHAKLEAAPADTDPQLVSVLVEADWTDDGLDLTWGAVQKDPT